MSDENERFGLTLLGKSVRKLNAQRTEDRSPIWFGLGTFGVIGWSVAVPTLLGAMLGAYVDRHHAGPHSWTLALMVGGLALGCTHAGFWMASQLK